MHFEIKKQLSILVGLQNEVDSANKPSFSHTTRRKPMHVTK